MLQYLLKSNFFFNTYNFRCTPTYTPVIEAYTLCSYNIIYLINIYNKPNLKIEEFRFDRIVEYCDEFIL